MTEQHRVGIAQLKEEHALKHLIPEDIKQIKLEDFPYWPRFTQALFRPLKRRMIELTGDRQQAYDMARGILRVVAKVIQGEMDLNDFPLPANAMDVIVKQEQTATEHLKQAYDPAWYAFIDKLGPLLYRRLYQITGGDEGKMRDYMEEILALAVQASGKVSSFYPLQYFV